MPNPSNTHPTRHFDTLVSPLEFIEQPAWLQQATAPQRRQLAEHRALGQQARRQATQAFAAIQSHHTYNLLDLAAFDSATVTPKIFYQVQHRQQLDERYPTYLHAMLTEPALQTAKQSAYLATLREEYTIACIKGDLGREGKRLLEWIVGAFTSSSPEFKDEGPLVGADVALCSTLRLSGDLVVPDIVVLGALPGDGPCVAFVPGHPRHPLKQYASHAHFFASLQCDLLEAPFRQFFTRFIPLRHQARTASRWLHSIAASDVPMDCVPLQQGVRSHVTDQMVARLLDDARYLIPATPEQATALEQSVPAFSRALEEHLLTGFGAGLALGEEDEGRVPSDWTVPLRTVKVGAASRRRWLPELSNYRLPAEHSPAGPPDNQGIYLTDSGRCIAINDAFYLVAKNSSGQWRIQHPTDPAVYQPLMRQNGKGAWHHLFEQPRCWSRLSLLRRLGPLTAGLDDERLLMLGRASGVTNRQLREVYLNGQDVPALLQDVVQRARIADEVTGVLSLVKQGRAVPEGYRVAQLDAFYQAVELYYGRSNSTSRPRRSDDLPTPAPCDTNCTPAPDLLFILWSFRLHSGIAAHRFEIAQTPPDNVVRELRRRFPDLPLSLAQRFVNDQHLIIAEQVQGLPEPLALNQTEQVRVLEQDARLSRALEGFTAPGSMNADTHTLAVRLLEYLPDWQPDTALLLRSAGRFGEPLAALGETDVDSPCVYLDDEEGWFSVGRDQVLLAQDYSDYGFWRALLHALSAAQRTALGLGLNEPERLYQRLRELALAHPARARLLLGMALLTVAPAQALQHSLAPNEDDVFSRESPALRLERLLICDHRWRLGAADNYLAYLVQQHLPINPAVVQLEQQRPALDSALDTWCGQTTDNSLREVRTATANLLRNAWEGHIFRRPVSLRFDNYGTHQLPPLPVPLPAVIALTVRDIQDLTHLPALLEHLPNLRRLELINLPLTELPLALPNLQQLRWLEISRTGINPSGFAPLGSLRLLQTLLLEDSESTEHAWSARGMEQIMASGSLRSFTLQNGNAIFADGVFAVLAQTTLHTLNLPQNSITLGPQDVAHLAAMTELRVLDLSHNPLSLAPDLRRLQYLEELDLSNTAIAQWPEGLQDLPVLQFADLGHLALASVPTGAGLTTGLRMSSAYLAEPMRQTFEQEMASVGNRYDESEEASDQDSASSDSSDAQTATLRTANALRDAARLFDGLSAEDRARAEQLVRLPGSATAEFFALLLRLDAVRTGHPLLAERTRQRIQALVVGAFSANLRSRLFEQAVDAVSCVDRDALVFSQMENLLHADQALASTSDESAAQELIAMGTSHWRLLRLKEHVASHVRAWRNEGHVIDYSEIELYYRIALSERLGLRDQPTTQLFTSYTTWVTQAMLDDAAAAVVAQQSELLPVYLQGQAYWQRFLDVAYSDRIDEIHRWRERIGEYLDAASSDEEMLPALSEGDRQRLRQVLVDSGRLAVQEHLPTRLQLDSLGYTRAYAQLLNSVEQARLELTEMVIRQPQPGPSWRL